MRFILIALAFLTTAFALGDSWMPPPETQTFTSENQQYRLTLYTPKPKTAQQCIGLLEKVDGVEPLELWIAPLVNSPLPIDAMILDDGSRVITFDNWFSIGEHPIVIYDEKGELIVDHSLESLNLFKYTLPAQYEELEFTVYRDDGRAPETETLKSPGYHYQPLITSSTSSTHWKENAIIILNEDKSRLLIRMPWGLRFGVDLEDGKLLPSEALQADEAYFNAQIDAEVARLLESEQPVEREKGCIIAGSDQLKRFIPRLKELLSDPSFDSGYTISDDAYQESYREYSVRIAAQAALEQMGIETGEITTVEKFHSDKDAAEVAKWWDFNAKPKANRYRR